MRRWSIIGIAAIVLIAAGITALAVTRDATAAEGPSQVGGIETAGETQLERLVHVLGEKGMLTDEERDAILDAPGPAWHGPGLRFERPGFGFGPGMALLGEVSELLGMEPPELIEAVAGGATLRELADDAGAGPDEVVAAIVEPVLDHLDEAVADGVLEEETASELAALIEEAALVLLDISLPPGLMQAEPWLRFDGAAPGPEWLQDGLGDWNLEDWDFENFQDFDLDRLDELFPDGLPFDPEQLRDGTFRFRSGPGPVPPLEELEEFFRQLDPDALPDLEGFQIPNELGEMLERLLDGGDLNRLSDLLGEPST